MPNRPESSEKTREHWHAQRAERDAARANRTAKIKNTEAQWQKKHAAALADAESLRRARDLHPVMSPLWVRANDGMLRADVLASYAFRKITENIVRNGGTPTHDALALHPDLAAPGWTPAIKATTKAYRVRLTPRAPKPAPLDPITPHTLSSVPRTTRDSKQTCEHLFTYWTRRIEHATNMRDQARQAGRNPALVAKWQRVINQAHAKRQAYAPARNVVREASTINDSRSQNS